MDSIPNFTSIGPIIIEIQGQMGRFLLCTFPLTVSHECNLYLSDTSRIKPVHGLQVYHVELPINELYEVFAIASWSYKSDDDFLFKILPPD